MLKKIPFLVWIFLLIFVLYNGYAYYLGQHVEIGHQRQMLEYWAFIEVGSRFSLFIIGVSGISWLTQNRHFSFLAYSLVTTLIFYILQIIISLSLFPEVQKPLIENNPTVGWGEIIVNWGDVEATTLFIANSLWIIFGLVIAWLAYFIFIFKGLNKRRG